MKSFLYEIYLNGSYYGCEYGDCGESAIKRLLSVEGEVEEGFSAREVEPEYVA
jgi:hypothetical protein